MSQVFFLVIRRFIFPECNVDGYLFQTEIYQENNPTDISFFFGLFVSWGGGEEKSLEF